MIDRTSHWAAYAAGIRESHPSPGSAPARFEWGTHPGSGPGAAAFGRDLRGHRFLELGCGPGHNAAYLAEAHGACVVAIDPVDLQISRARARYGHLTGTTFLACEALRYLGRRAEQFDVVYSVFGAVGLVDPEQLLPAISRSLRPRGLLVFSVPHPHRAGRGSYGAGPHWDVLRLPDGTRRPLVRWEIGVRQWRQTLARHELRLLAVRELGDPRCAWTTTLIVRARRLDSVRGSTGQGCCKEPARKVPYPPGKRPVDRCSHR
ncbi:class I SAM-dependent methyltransferase [Streptomyces sp. NPDC058459]|uniref:class I SAM-dependent methyltransferase n=1 Tax=Streptomyces sp. NPDC058459 TaxID=3346508 RepID=UPI003660069D